MTELNTPILPYAGTSGWSGTDTSRERAEDRDTSGVTAATQLAVLNILCNFGEEGRTVKELRESVPSLGHHGSVSGALSVLHKKGLLVLLRARRNRCHVYVHPGFVKGRAVVPPKTKHVYLVQGSGDGRVWIEGLYKSLKSAEKAATKPGHWIEGIELKD